MGDILTNIGTVITSVTTWITSLLQSASAIFYTPATGDGTGSFTFIGTLLLVAFGLGMVWVAINFIRGLVIRG